MFTRSPFFRVAVLVLAVTVPTFAFAGSIGTPAGGGDSIRWDLSVTGHDSVVLTVSHDGEVWTKTFRAGRPVVFELRDLPSDVNIEGSYQYELRVVPIIPAGLQKKLTAARAAGDEKAASKALRDAGVVVPEAQSGAFVVIGGSIADPNATESGTSAKAGATPTTNSVSSTPGLRGPAARFDPVVNDQVIPDDLIVQGSVCVGFDCVNNESFGFDTIKLKENNLRIKAEDTSVGSFPTNDWQLTFNDSASGGASKFSVEDITGAKVPMTITAGATTNSIFVDSTGRIGARTSTPVLDFHIATSNTPAVRLEQNNSGGFTAQTWDVAGNEANFFVRDVTGGSRLPFRIRPGAPTSSIDIAADGDVGIGTASPAAKLHVVTGTATSLLASESGAAAKIQGALANGTGTATVAINSDGGNVGVGTTTANQKLEVNGAINTTGSAGYYQGNWKFTDYTGSTVRLGGINAGQWDSVEFWTSGGLRAQVTSTGRFVFANGTEIMSGTGSPEGVITAPSGSMFLRTDGAATTTLYIKTGAGNTGWVAK